MSAEPDDRFAPRAVIAYEDFDKVEIHVLPVQGNVYMLVGAGGNITLQVGNDGVLLVDTEYARTVADRLAGRPGTPVVLRITFPERRLELRATKGWPDAEIQQVVRGVVLSRRQVDVGAGGQPARRARSAGRARAHHRRGRGGFVRPRHRDGVRAGAGGGADAARRDPACGVISVS